jgi:glycosyltransferase involved in cell wall biosynthesis
LVARLQLQNSVHFDFEFKSETEIQNIFSACDIVAQTYHTATQSGVTPLAYFYKKPLVVSDINGLNTPIINDGTGVCVNQNPQAIARGILELISASKMQDAVKNITKAYDKYSWSKWVIEWNQFNEKL